MSPLGRVRWRVLRWIARLYLWATYRLYNEFAPLYDLASWLVSFGRWAGWRCMALDYITGPRVLEVGFGTGELLRALAGRGLDVYGLELSSAMQRVTARKLRRRRLDVPRLRGRVQGLPFADGCLDTIVSTFPAEYILDPEALREMARVLRRPDTTIGDSGGRLVVVGLVIHRARARQPLQFNPIRPPDLSIERFCEAAHSTGLAVTLISRFDPPVRVPVIIAERSL